MDDIKKTVEDLRLYYIRNHEFPEAHAAEMLNITTSLFIEISRLTSLVEAGEREKVDVTEREGKVCPEDVPFDEYIRTLERQLAESQKELKIQDDANEILTAQLAEAKGKIGELENSLNSFDKINVAEKERENKDLRSANAELKRENEGMRERLQRTLITMRHARVFITSREKMHIEGVLLYDDEMQDNEQVIKQAKGAR